MRLTSKNNPDPHPNWSEVIGCIAFNASLLLLGCAVLYLLYRGASCVA
jgi:hypothetical protein